MEMMKQNLGCGASDWWVGLLFVSMNRPGYCDVIHDLASNGLAMILTGGMG